ncbi:hypothetical protein [Citrobacter portucalensis]
MRLNNIQFIATAEFGKFLLAKGWNTTTGLEGRATLWESDKHQDYEILQPINPKASDYARRVRDLVEVLAEVENKEVNQIAQEINEISDDVIRIRIIHDDVSDGSIPFNDGVDLFLKAKDLLSSAARSLVSPKKEVYSGKAPKIVSNYFENLRLSQTEIGSYVLKIESPILLEQAEQDDHLKEPFGRSVSNRIIHSITNLDRAVELFSKTGKFKHFEEAVSAGVGASLCSALVGMSGRDRKRSIEISLQPSPYADLLNLEHLSVTVKSEDIPIIEKAIGYYLNEYTVPVYSLVGRVTKLARELDFGDGNVTIFEKKNTQTGKAKHVEVTLNENLYNDAIQAHEQSSDMRLTGTLVISGRKAYLTDVINDQNQPDLFSGKS